MTTRRALTLGAGIASALVLGVVTGSARGAGAGASFTDPAGDNRGAPDVTAVAVSDDYASGTIQISITAAGFSTIDTSQKPDIDVYIDADQNSATGSMTGSDYDLWAMRAGWSIFHNDGTTWSKVTVTPTMVASLDGETISWRLNKTDLGGTSGFSFYVASGVYDSNGNLTGVDYAPDNGKWTYTVSTPPAPTPTTTAPPVAKVKPVIGAPTITPTAAAGQEGHRDLPGLAQRHR